MKYYTSPIDYYTLVILNYFQFPDKHFEPLQDVPLPRRLSSFPTQTPSHPLRNMPLTHMPCLVPVSPFLLYVLN